MKQVLDVAGMRCGGCERLMREELVELDGVRDVHADSKAGRVAFELDDPGAQLAEVVDLIHELGFSVTH
ncbi:MAG: heavy-metal-associated domain-containing protein [Thermoleophilia bacterium]|nr:heavy-metal-associated domain-containing protein [Thermoleophilia bacterium]